MVKGRIVERVRCGPLSLQPIRSGTLLWLQFDSANYLSHVMCRGDVVAAVQQSGRYTALLGMDLSR